MVLFKGHRFLVIVFVFNLTKGIVSLAEAGKWLCVVPFLYSVFIFRFYVSVLSVLCVLVVPFYAFVYLFCQRRKQMAAHDRSL